MQKDDFLNLGNLGNKRTWSRPPRFIHRQILCSNNNKGKQQQNKQTLTRFATLAFFQKDDKRYLPDLEGVLHLFTTSQDFPANQTRKVSKQLINHRLCSITFSPTKFI